MVAVTTCSLYGFFFFNLEVNKVKVVYTFCSICQAHSDPYFPSIPPRPGSWMPFGEIWLEGFPHPTSRRAFSLFVGLNPIWWEDISLHEDEGAEKARGEREKEKEWNNTQREGELRFAGDSHFHVPLLSLNHETSLCHCNKFFIFIS